MKVLTANSLQTGEALFWNKGQWKVRFHDGDLILQPHGCRSL